MILALLLVTLTISADWPLYPGDRDWLERSYLPAQFEEARANVQWGYELDKPPIIWNGYVIDVRLHPTVFLADGKSACGYTNLPMDTTLHVEIAWECEGLGMHTTAHEFAHVVALLAPLPNWDQFGHGTARDAFLGRLLAIGRRVYFPGHAYDPFK